MTQGLLDGGNAVDYLLETLLTEEVMLEVLELVARVSSYSAGETILWKAGKSTVCSRAACGWYMRMNWRKASASVPCCRGIGAADCEIERAQRRFCKLMITRAIIILLAFAVVLSIPYVVRPAREVPPEDALQLVMISPHIEAIQYEFGRAFRDWHEAKYGGRW